MLLVDQSKGDETWAVIKGEVNNVEPSNTLLNVDGKNYSMENELDELGTILGGTPELAIGDKGMMLSILM